MVGAQGHHPALCSSDRQEPRLTDPRPVFEPDPQADSPARHQSTGHARVQLQAAKTKSNGVRTPQSEPLFQLCDFMKTTQPLWALVPHQ